MRKKSKIFIGPVEIAGYYANLSKGLKSLGVDCDYITYQAHSFGYGGETKQPYLLQFANWFSKHSGSESNSNFRKLLYSILRESLTSAWGLIAIFKYDTFIFGFGRTLLRGNIDLAILHFFKKNVLINIAHGADARPPFIDGAYQSKQGVQIEISLLNKLSRKKKKSIDYISRYANIVIGAPYSTSQFCNIRFINTFALGLPISINDNITVSLIDQKKLKSRGVESVRILHAPSHPAAKGSTEIIKAIESLKNKGHLIDFVLVHGRPYSEVLTELHNCDFVVDQIFSDTPMAGFAAEAACFGKPAVVAGYGLKSLGDFIPEGMLPPSKVCHPDGIEQAIEDLIFSKEKREKLGRDAQLFVCEKWDAKKVAYRYMKLIQGDVPDEWWLDPKNVLYIEGAGQSVKRTKENIRGLVELGGVESLQISHRPDLEKAILEFAGMNETKS
jgi:glycosyltransferase involved in cell wall biosynthesis